MNNVSRLFTIFKPYHYVVDLKINQDSLTFDGKVIISGIKVDNTSDFIKLHSKNLQIKNILINKTQCAHSSNDDELSINLGDVKSPDLEIEIHYSGKITDSMHGIYPAYPKNGTIMIGTQFESHHAREALPCIDEPEAKATFDLKITSQAPTVLSNMPIKSTEKIDDIWQKFSFNTTPKMSTYLLAFITGDLQKVSTTTNNGTEISVWSSKDHDIESLVFPLEVAVKTTEFFNDYFGVEYPLPKCDHVALPDFSSGAMENWGLITYREVALIADPDTVSASTKEFIATVIAHEISHQWFGNLVTMKWWDDLWLNESFATLMEYVAIDAIYPDWNVMLGFASHDALSAFRRDILPGVQPVATEVNHPDEISTLFDPSIVYAKGARLLLMAYNLVGDRNFRKGLQKYFEKHAYANTTGDDLWAALGRASRQDVGNIMNSWIKNPGFPYITVSNKSSGEILIKQKQLSSEANNSKQIWPIPLWTDIPQKVIIMSSREQSIDDIPFGTRFNSIGGHYITHYASKKWRVNILEQIKSGQIKADGRLLFLHDSLMLAKCNVSSLTETADNLKYYTSDKEEAVWSVISVVISDIRMIIEGNKSSEDELKAVVNSLIDNQLQDLGLIDKDSDTPNDKKLRSIIASLGVYAENQVLISDAEKIYQKELINDLPSDSRIAILTAAVRSKRLNAFDELLRVYPNTTSSELQQDILAALCSSHDKKQLDILISLLKDSSFVRKQDIDRMFIYLLRNQKSKTNTWKWLVKNWQWITEQFAQDKSFDSYPRYAASAFSTQDWLDEYKAFFIPLISNPSLKRNIELGIKDIENKVSWRERDQKSVEAWLKEQ